jgi:hypothetical protein
MLSVVASKSTVQPKVSKQRSMSNGELKTTVKHFLNERNERSELYSTDGIFAFLSEHPVFKKTTLAVIFINSVYIGIDSERNTAPSLYSAGIGWQVMANLFAVYFCIELLIRFMAFKATLLCFRDSWFVFDSLLVILLIMDTWLVSSICTALNDCNKSTDVLRVLRLLRLLRALRIVRSGNDGQILLAGIYASLRPVCFVTGVLIFLLYFFSVSFTLLLSGTASGQEFFATILLSAYTLVCSGLLCDNLTLVTSAVMADSVFAVFLFFGFMIISLLTFLNLLVGIVGSTFFEVAFTEKESIYKCDLSHNLLKLLEDLVNIHDKHITKHEFLEMLAIEEIAQLLDDFDYDVENLVDAASFIFQDHARDPIDFSDFIEVLIRLRESTTVTVGDLMGIHRVYNRNLKMIDAKLSSLLEQHTTDEQECSDGCVFVGQPKLAW